MVTSSGTVVLEFWLRTSRRIDTAMEHVVTNLKQQLAAQQQALQQLQLVLEAQQARAVQRESALQAHLSDLSGFWNLYAAEAELRVEPEPVALRQIRSFIESRALSRSIVEGLGIQVLEHGRNSGLSSTNTLGWAAQKETPILSVDEVEAGPDSVEALDSVQNTTRGAGLEAWRKLARRFGPRRQWDENGRC